VESNDVNTSWSGIFTPPANALGLSIEEKDLLFCTCIGRGPLPLPSSQWTRMTSFRWHINPQHTAASTPTKP